MIDCREIQIVDNTFDLKNTVVQNQKLKTKNKHLFYLGLIAVGLLIGFLYFNDEKDSEES